MKLVIRKVADAIRPALIRLLSRLTAPGDPRDRPGRRPILGRRPSLPKQQ